MLASAQHTAFIVLSALVVGISIKAISVLLIVYLSWFPPVLPVSLAVPLFSTFSSKQV